PEGEPTVGGQKGKAKAKSFKSTQITQNNVNKKKRRKKSLTIPYNLRTFHSSILQPFNFLIFQSFTFHSSL
ncbi:MAG: hypothetical protein IKQ68_01170, partial [Prevotella sp.]|nr:hypothetical protein [Prevotella sp.]